ncbi:hypothetical protein LTR82_017781 [Friedmanniomyces endolithicus]|uniref:Glutathione S-transferase UstS-like C-terminal domain-containing protein n=1 Tax=Friedmanniomyces endolithicus TaxID=329885 RepID=A0AAN6F556_9PEZI|nr:hypothetical protein LTR82_017781 [Friedmanniomyces endolithicus]
MPEKVTLYDLASSARLLLNYKKIPYDTDWMEYPDLQQKFKALYAAHKSPSVPSLIILESLYPSPPLHLETGLDREVNKLCSSIVFAVSAELMAPIVDDWLQEPSVSWFVDDRQKRLGMNVWELREQKGGERIWSGAEEKLKQLKGFLRNHQKDEGPFVMGSVLSYADLVIIALFESLSRVRKEVYDRIMAYDKDFKKLHEAGEKWTKEDD